MAQTALTLTVYFEDPFWVGVFERVEDDQLSVCRHVFGAEPTDAEVLAFVQQRFRKLVFSQPSLQIARYIIATPSAASAPREKPQHHAALAPKRNKRLPLNTEASKKAAAALFSAKPAKKHRQNATPNAAPNKKPNTVGISQPGAVTQTMVFVRVTAPFVLNFAINCPHNGNIAESPSLLFMRHRNIFLVATRQFIWQSHLKMAAVKKRLKIQPGKALTIQ